jgi:murein L,D-transpeptidase YafK
MHKIIIAIAFTIITSCNAFAIEKADRVEVVKSTKTLSLFKGDNLIERYSVVFGGNPVGPKQQDGDKRTPEGVYVLDFKKADSAFHKAIHISYPNEHDVEYSRKRGVSPGGAIMVHGQKNGFGWASFLTQQFNWTNGCIALSNKNMESVWEAVDAGTLIEIKP